MSGAKIARSRPVDLDVVAAWLENFSQKTESKLDDMLAPMVTTTARCTIVILALVQIASILSDEPLIHLKRPIS